MSGLFRLCEKGDLEGVKQIVSMGARADLRDLNGDTPLMEASFRGHTAIVKFLLENNARAGVANESGRTALMWAAANGHLPVIDLLLGPLPPVSQCSIYSKDMDGRTALSWAASNGHTDVVRALIAKRASVFTEDKNGDCALHEAAQGGHYLTVIFLADITEDIINSENHGQKTPLILASGGDPENAMKIGECLVRRKATVNHADKYGVTALINAAKGSNSKLVDYLLQNYANANAVDKYGWTALHQAAYKGNQTTAKSLVEHDADIDRITESGFTPLMLAAQLGHDSVVEYLISKRANVFISTESKKTALRLARYRSTRALIRERMQRLDPQFEDVPDTDVQKREDDLSAATEQRLNQIIARLDFDGLATSRLRGCTSQGPFSPGSIGSFGSIGSIGSFGSFHAGNPSLLGSISGSFHISPQLPQYHMAGSFSAAATTPVQKTHKQGGPFDSSPLKSTSPIKLPEGPPGHRREPSRSRPLHLPSLEEEKKVTDSPDAPTPRRLETQPPLPPSQPSSQPLPSRLLVIPPPSDPGTVLPLKHDGARPPGKSKDRKAHVDDTSLRALVRERPKVISIKASAPLEKALALMTEHSILSLAVTDEYKGYVGLISVFDILTTLLFDPRLDALSDLAAKLEKDPEADKEKKLDQPLPGLFDKVQGALGASVESQEMHQLEAKDSLDGLLAAFCQGIHRVLVRDDLLPLSPSSSRAPSATGLHSGSLEPDVPMGSPLKMPLSRDFSESPPRAHHSHFPGSPPVPSSPPELISPDTPGDPGPIRSKHRKKSKKDIPRISVRGGKSSAREIPKKSSNMILSTSQPRLHSLTDSTSFSPTDDSPSLASMYSSLPKVDQFSELPSPVDQLPERRPGHRRSSSATGPLSKPTAHVTYPPPTAPYHPSTSSHIPNREPLNRTVSGGSNSSGGSGGGGGGGHSIPRGSRIYFPTHKSPPTGYRHSMIVVSPLDKSVKFAIPSRPGTPSNSGVRFGLLTQTDIIRLFQADMPRLGAVANSKVGTLVTLEPEMDPETGTLSGSGGGGLVCIDTTSTALAAFRRLVLREMSSAPIVDQDRKGEMVGTISDSDVRSLAGVRTGDLFLPVLDFLKKTGGGGDTKDGDEDEEEEEEEKEEKEEKKKKKETAKKQIARHTTCSKHDTLSTVIDKILTERTKRAWIIDAVRRPLGVVSMTDIIKAVYLDRMQQAGGPEGEATEDTSFSSSASMDTTWTGRLRDTSRG